MNATSWIRGCVTILIASTALLAPWASAQFVLSDVRLEASALESIHPFNSFQHVDSAQSSFQSYGQWGQASTVTLPQGSRAAVDIKAWGQGWQVSADQTAQLGFSDPHNGAQADTRAFVFFTITEPGLYRLWAEVDPLLPFTPGGGSSHAFTFGLSGFDGASTFTVLDVDTGEVFQFLDTRVLPIGDYALEMSAALVMSARYESTLSATTHFGIAAIPEPAALLLLLPGLLMMDWLGGRKRCGVAPRFR